MKALIITLIILVFLIRSASAQQLEFLNLDNTDGLSNNQVESIFKDSRGFLWIGTRMGVNRYDGTNFKTYKYDKDDPLSPIHDKIMDLQEDIDGNLWMRGDSYIFFDWRSESFINNIDSLLDGMGLPHSPTKIEIAQNKDLYLVYSGKGIYKYDIQTKKVFNYQQSMSEDNLDLSDIVDIKVQGVFMWVLHANGILERINTVTAIVDTRNKFFQKNSQNATITKSLFVDSDNEIWIYPSIDDKGTAFFDLEKNRWTLFDIKSQPALSSNLVRCIEQCKDGKIWIGTDHGGINIFSKIENKIEVVENNIDGKFSISRNSINCFYMEDNGTVWAGTYKNGLIYHNVNMYKFQKPPLFYAFRQNEEVFDCNSLFVDFKGNLWIGTNGEGLIKYDLQSGNVQRFRNNPDDYRTISSNIITSIFEDSSHTLWVGTFQGGLNALEDNKFRRYQVDENNPQSISSRSVYGLAEDRNSNLWIATLGGGIDCLEPERNIFEHYNTQNSKLLSDYILSVFTDSLNNIYFCSDIGIYTLNHRNQVLPYFEESTLTDSLTTVSANYLIIDSRGLLWIATKKGINIVNPNTGRFKHITVDDGLPSNEVVSLVEDNSGDIWAGTGNGLVYVKCNSENQDLEYSLTLFDTNDGLPSPVFNPNAVFKDKTGQIYMGTTGGYVSFVPSRIVFNENAPSARFTDLIIANQIIKPNISYDDHVILNRSITDLNEITLNYNETNFTILFSALNLIHPLKSKYRYKLEGLDKQWTEISNGKGIVSYSNLNPGTYRLIVHASNEDNIWASDPITLKIVVEPPFWFSWWAYVIYLVAVILLVRVFIEYKLRKQTEKYEQKKRMLEVSKLHEVDELKLKFFTNISHEFKTPLTLILSPLEKLMKSPIYKDDMQTLSIMYRNAKGLLNMVNEILDFRKLDQNKMTLNMSRGDIIEFTKEICTSFSSLAAEKSIKLTFTSYFQELKMDFDGDKMYKIIANLISNAFKYAEEGHIDVNVGIKDQNQNNHALAVKQMCLKVTDTGIGIAPQYIDKIFDRFFRIENSDKRSQPGTGVGLHLVREFAKLHGGTVTVDSIEGQGSTFTVFIPIQDSVLADSEVQNVIYPGGVGSALETIEKKKEISSRSNLPLLLIVDDNEDFCDFITGLFSRDYQVISAHNGQEGYGFVLDKLPDIILCDVMMPKMDGYEFCRRVKDDINSSHIPIILLTAKSSDENKYSGIEAGADDYISKPFNIDILKLKIAKIVEKQKALQEKFQSKIDVSPSEVEIMSLDEKFVQKAISLVEVNMSNIEFRVEDLSKDLGMSRVCFYKKILALTGKSPSEFIRIIRLKRAASLLGKSQMYINEVALEVGFKEAKYFRKYFKDEFGVTPTEYKKKV